MSKRVTRSTRLVRQRPGQSRRGWQRAFAACALAFCGVAAQAQAPAPAPGAGQTQGGAAAVMPRCTALLPPEALRGVLGNGLEPEPQRQREPHVVDCAWSRSGGPNIALQWFDRPAIQSSSVTRTIEGYADMLLTAGEERAGNKREAVSGLGSRAATVQGTSRVLLVVTRPDGVVRALLGGFTPRQTAQIAKVLSGAV